MAHSVIAYVVLFCLIKQVVANFSIEEYENSNGSVFSRRSVLEQSTDLVAGYVVNSYNQTIPARPGTSSPSYGGVQQFVYAIAPTEDSALFVSNYFNTVDNAVSRRSPLALEGNDQVGVVFDEIIRFAPFSDGRCMTHSMTIDTILKSKPVVLPLHLSQIFPNTTTTNGDARAWVHSIAGIDKVNSLNVTLNAYYSNMEVVVNDAFILSPNSTKANFFIETASPISCLGIHGYIYSSNSTFVVYNATSDYLDHVAVGKHNYISWSNGVIQGDIASVNVKIFAKLVDGTALPLFINITSAPMMGSSFHEVIFVFDDLFGIGNIESVNWGPVIAYGVQPVDQLPGSLQRNSVLWVVLGSVLGGVLLIVAVVYILHKRNNNNINEPSYVRQKNQP